MVTTGNFSGEKRTNFFFLIWLKKYYEHKKIYLWAKKGTKTLLFGLGNDWKGTKRPEAYFIISSIRNIIGQEGTFMVKKGTTLFLGMIEKGQKGLKLKVEGTLLGQI